MARTGSNIYKRKDGRYEGRILIGKNSRRKPKYIYIYAKTLREVKRKMSEVQAPGPGMESQVSDISVQTAAEKWLNSLQKKLLRRSPVRKRPVSFKEFPVSPRI